MHEVTFLETLHFISNQKRLQETFYMHATICCKQLYVSTKNRSPKTDVDIGCKQGLRIQSERKAIYKTSSIV